MKNASFEQDYAGYWNAWQAESEDRNLTVTRSYQVPYGFGSYSLAVKAEGPAGEAFSAGLTSDSEKNSFTVSADTKYSIIVHAKSDQPVKIYAYLGRADDHSAITEVRDFDVTGEWNRFSAVFAPDYSGPAVLTIVYGSLASDSYLYLDGVSVFEQSATISTDKVYGNIKDQDKYLYIRDLPYCNRYDVEIELPYFDPNGFEAKTKKFNPKRITDRGVYFDMLEGTFSGVGRVYVYGSEIGSFDYEVKPEVLEFYPALMRADQDLVLIGRGFNPLPGHTFAIINANGGDGTPFEHWAEPHHMDSKLSQAAFKMPLGVKSGSLRLYTTYTNKEGNEEKIFSSSASYKVKPVIFRAEWSKPGFEHVGDKLRIYGKGVTQYPYVIFYNEEGVRIDKKRAKLIQITETAEIIEVDTTLKAVNFSVTVETNGVESDKASALEHTAKPRLTGITSDSYRKMYSSGEKITAAQAGDEITIHGQGLNPYAQEAYIEFQAVGTERARVALAPEQFSSNGTYVKTEVPKEAVNGYLNIWIGGEPSNSLPLEIIPEIRAIYPETVVPGEDVKIVASGIGTDIELVEVQFFYDKSNIESVKPREIYHNGGLAEVIVEAPQAISNGYSYIGIKYNHWSSEKVADLTVAPRIYGAAINLDNGILTIKGSGFSIYGKENEITYKYADGTVVDPDARIIGVYPTEEGQEIRIKVMDDYHYGFVQVKVGDKLSNEVNFGPVKIRKIARRVEFVRNIGEVKGVLYITGYNFGEGGVNVGGQWADIHYRSDHFIIAVVDKESVNGTVIVAKQ